MMTPRRRAEPPESIFAFCHYAVRDMNGEWAPSLVTLRLRDAIVHAPSSAFHYRVLYSDAAGTIGRRCD